MRILAEIPTRLVLFILSVLLFVPFLGNAPLFDWDEINFAESAREMLVSGNYLQVQINFLPFWEKPPLFFWMQVLSYKVFGINEFAARFPNALCGILTLQIIYGIGSRFFSRSLGIIWVLVYIGSILPHLYFKSGIIDPWFNLFIFIGIYYLLSLSFDSDFIHPKKARKIRFRAAVLSGVFIGLAVLTKGPVGLLMQVLAGGVYFAISRGKKIFNRYEFMSYLLGLLAVSLCWYGLEYMRYGSFFFEQFFAYHMRLLTEGEAGHGGPIWYHLPVILLGCFPASVYMLDAMRRYSNDTINQVIFKRWMFSLLLVVVVVFSLVHTKIVHYSSLAYFPVTFFAAYSIKRIIKHYINWNWMHLLSFQLIALIFGGLMLALPWVGMHTAEVSDFLLSKGVKDAFLFANLEAEVYWSVWDYLPGTVFLLSQLPLIWFFVRRNTVVGLSWQFIWMCLAIQVVLVIFIPRVDRYTQQAAVDYYEQLSERDVYLNVVGFKSYAHYFYGRKNIGPMDNAAFREWLAEQGKSASELDAIELNSLERYWMLTGPIDKDAWFVTRIDRLEQVMTEYPGLAEMSRQNGFVLLKREMQPRSGV